MVVAGVCVAVIGWLVWGATTSPDSTAIGDLPTVEEVVVAAAHQHGIELPELTDEDRAQLSAAPSAASTLTPYQQVRQQLLAVRDSAGVVEALAILAEVALLSDDVAAQCPLLYDDLRGSASGVPTSQAVCPAVSDR